jgi:hypothetical protein
MSCYAFRDFSANQAAHIRSGLVRKGPRINDRGAAGNTLCGAPLTSEDILIGDYRSMVKHGDPMHAVCKACIARLTNK